MHRSSETIGTIAGGAGQGAGRAHQPGEVADRDHPVAVPEGERPDVPLCLALERARYRPQGAGQARDRDRADHGHRRGGAHPAHHGARPFVRRMGLLRLAGVPGQRDRGPASDGRGADLCPALCPVHPGGDCRGGRPRCAGPRSRPQSRRRSSRPGRMGKSRTGMPSRCGPARASGCPTQNDRPPARRSPFWPPISRRRCGIGWSPNSTTFNPPTRRPAGPIGACPPRTR